MCENVVVFLQNVVMFCFVFQAKIWDIIVDKENSMISFDVKTGYSQIFCSFFLVFNVYLLPLTDI